MDWKIHRRPTSVPERSKGGGLNPPDSSLRRFESCHWYIGVPEWSKGAASDAVSGMLIAGSNPAINTTSVPEWSKGTG